MVYTQRDRLLTPLCTVHNNAKGEKPVSLLSYCRSVKRKYVIEFKH